MLGIVGESNVKVYGILALVSCRPMYRYKCMVRKGGGGVHIRLQNNSTTTYSRM